MVSARHRTNSGVPNDATILVTGGAGFIGSAYVRQQLQRGTGRVITLDALTYAGNLQSLEPIMRNPRHVFVHGDIRDEALVRQLLADYRPSAVVHFAAESHVDRSIDAPRLFTDVNVIGTQRLLDCVHRYWRDLSARENARFRLINISTDEVYGSVKAPRRSTEDSSYAPNSPYAASKAAADHLARSYFRTYGVPVITTHACNNYGPFQFPEKLIPLMITKALRTETLPIYGDGSQVRQWLHVYDHCRAINLIVHRGIPGQVYNLGGTSEMSNLALVRVMCRLLDALAPNLVHRPCEALINFVADRPGHDGRYALDSTKARRTLGWRPLIGFEDGLRRTVHWHLKHGDWISAVADNTDSCRRRGLLEVADDASKYPDRLAQRG